MAYRCIPSNDIYTYIVFLTSFPIILQDSFLEKDCKDVRKYILSSSLQGDVYELNLEEKERLNLFDANLGE